MIWLDHKCPNCGKAQDAVSGIDESGRHDEGAINDGAFGLCFSCGEWMVHEGGFMRKPTVREFVEIAENDLARKVREAWVLVKGKVQ